MSDTEATAPQTGPAAGAVREIASTAELAAQEWVGSDDPPMPAVDLVANETPSLRGLQFHISMQPYSMNALEELIVEAAARLLVGDRQGQFRKLIEDRCVSIITEKADKTLSAVTDSIIDQPLTPQFGDKKPITMREFIGLTGREYLTERVTSEGNVTRDSWGRATPRIEWIVSKLMDRKFKTEIERATSAAISEVQNAVKARHKELVDVELARVREAIAKATGAA